MDDPFRVRLNCVDHYQAEPTHFDPCFPKKSSKHEQKSDPKVPVIRVFGATETGQKVCAHIHGAFPYLYIRYDGSLKKAQGTVNILLFMITTNAMVVDAYIHQLHLSIDHALAVSYRRNMYDGKTAFVAHISLVKGVPFYGYHVGYQLFLKLYMLNPLHMTRLADLLRQGAIMKQVFQPYESHMQYLAQWMCDYSLYGCAYLDCAEAAFRDPVPDYLDLDNTTHRWHSRTIDPSCISKEDLVPRQSHCSIEVDIQVQHILNRRDVNPRPIHHDFVERKIPISSDEKLVQSMAGLWRDETRRRKLRMGLKDPGSTPFPPEVLVSVSADPRNSQPGGWIHEEEYRDKMHAIIHDERLQAGDRTVEFDNFVSKPLLWGDIKTSLESVEDLYPENLARFLVLHQLSQAEKAINGITASDIPNVDESRAVAYQDDLVNDSDEEALQAMDSSRKRGADEDKVDGELSVGEENSKAIQKETAIEGNASEPIRSLKLSAKHDVAVDGTNGGSKGAFGPTSSSELEALGIRTSGDYAHIAEDAFEIPAEATYHVNGRNKLDSEPKMKKRKLNPAALSSQETLLLSGNGEDRLSQIRQSSDDSSGFTNHGDLNVAEDMRVPNTGKSQEQLHNGRQRYSALSSSQDGIHARHGNRTLSFPVVKDPQDPHTIRKLSQSTKSPKSSQDRKLKTVSFVGPSEPKSGLSRQADIRSLSLTTPSRTSASQLLQSCSQIHESFSITSGKQVFCLNQLPPPPSEILMELRQARLPSIIYQEAHYSKEGDVPERAREYAGKEFKIESMTVPFLPDFDPKGTSSASVGDKPGTVLDKYVMEAALKRRKNACSLRVWEFEQAPPSVHEVRAWLEQGRADQSDRSARLPGAVGKSPKKDLSQVDGPTQKNKHGFKYSPKQKSTSVQHETQYMSIMSLEIHVNTRGNLVPNPEQDEIDCVFWCFQSDDENLQVNCNTEGTHIGILALSEDGGLAHKISQHTAVEVEEEHTEIDLITRIVDIVRAYDPDILTGYEVHGGSWGYMIERARCRYDYNLCDEFSRMRSQSHGRFGKEDDRWGFNHTSTIRVTGRHMINIWRAMRGELNLLQYTMENVVFQLCHRRIPHYSFQDLTVWYLSNQPKDLAKVVDYYVTRVQLDLEILEQNELVPRTSEQARLLGVDFFSVFSRGSQFKVESLMFRIAKPENFLLPSPSRKQVGQQNALECLPLVMEPQSAFYNSPLLVLDFQSLYPSVMIAYNYCYSTFLGRVVSWRGQNKMGFANYEREPQLLQLLKDQINVAPNGIMYAKPEIRKSLLAKMLGEILETRVMVKSGMKVDKDDKTLQRLLNNRQLALKLIANVTYGYTSASFSGRMPCSEIADSIVQTGRETLEKAIAMIHSVERWGAEVVYGDTDSLFVYLKGRTKDEAFDIGQEIAKTITDMNPRPVKLKFEKVYLPCVLLAKKRYVGFKYESKTQKEPDFDAKGIETVRRDGTPAEQKIEEKALKILFRSADLSEVKQYFQKQCSKIMKGKVSIQDFCFAKEVKLGTYSDKGLPPPGALISTRRMLEDPRAEPQYGERVPYVVITGAPGARLIDRCVPPETLLYNDNNELDAEYYISKNLIPPLERIFNLVGANVRQWYDEMPKFQRIRRIDQGPILGRKETSVSKKTLESYMKSSSCLVCHDKLEEEGAICTSCTKNADRSLSLLRTRLNAAEKRAFSLERVCRSCASLAWGEDVKCDSKDCPVFYTRSRHIAGLRSTRAISEPVMALLRESETRKLEW